MDRPGWTARLAHVEQRTAIERQAAELKASIEALGGHPLLTDALTAADLAMCTLGKWHDDGEPGASHRCPICDLPFAADDMCLIDIELGTSHAECLAGSPMVDLDTGDELPEGSEPEPFRYQEASA